jgi:hypothetical protein
MTSAEAIRQLRTLIVGALSSAVSRQDHDVVFMLETVAEIARDGVDPIIELRIRRFWRLYGDCCPGNGRAVRHS